MKNESRRNHSSVTTTRTALALTAALCGIAATGTAVAANAQSLTVAHATSLRNGDAVIGALPMTQPIHIEVALKMRDRSGLDALIADNAKKQIAHIAPHLMTSEEFLATHAPTQLQAQMVANYLTSMGYRNVVIAPNRLLVSADGTAATARNAFMTTFAQVRTHDGRIAFANTDEVRIPPALSDKVLAVVGLQNVHEAQAVATSAEPASIHTKILQGHYPTEFPSIYANSGLFGGSSSIGVITEGNMSPVLTDLDIFAVTTGQKVTYSVVRTNGSSSDTSHVAVWDLASQVAAGMSINLTANLILYAVPSLSNADLTADYNRVVHDNHAKIIEASIRQCETDAQADGTAAAQEAIFQVAVAHGQTFVFPAGNSGADECGDGGQTPSWPASSQYVIAAGGTTLNADRSNWFGETAWKLAGGSASTFEPMPSWQTAFGVPGTTRGVPDIAFDANPASGALIVVNRSLTQMGGTALSAALFAGVWRSVLDVHGTTSGFAGPVLYALPQGDFHDIVAGSNGNSALRGWDYASGRGSMLVDKVLADSAGLVNKPPVAAFSLAAPASQTVKVTDASTDSDGTIVAHAWDFGDGSAIAHGTNPSHTYAASGVYQIVETVTDDDGATNHQKQTFDAGTVQLLQNPGYETGSFQGWDVHVRGQGGSLAVINDPNFVFAGTYAARMRRDHTSFLEQRVVLPAYKASAALTFHLRVDDPAHSPGVTDTITVQVDGTTLATFTNLDASPNYATYTIDLTSYIGQAPAIDFVGATGASQGTNFYIDDVMVTVQ